MTKNAQPNNNLTASPELETAIGTALVRRPPGNKPMVATPVGLEAIERLAAVGLSKPTIAKKLGISYTSLKALAKRQPEVAEALESGRGELQDHLVNLLKGQAGNGSVASAIFLLKAMCGFSDQPGKSAGANTSAPTVNITIPPQMTPEMFAQMTGAAPAVVEAETPSHQPTQEVSR